MMEDGWSSVIKSYDDLKDGKVPAGQEEYWMIRAQFEEELNQVILQILSVDEDGDHFDVTDEFGYDNLESRLKKMVKVSTIRREKYRTRNDYISKVR